MASKNSKNPPRRFADASRSLGLLVRLGDLARHHDRGLSLGSNTAKYIDTLVNKVKPALSHSGNRRLQVLNILDKTQQFGSGWCELVGMVVACSAQYGPCVVDLS